MIWQNPWAWLGVATVAVPILIHLLGRGHARVQRFPTLRFVRVSRLLPTRRTRVNDLPLLLVRLAILAVAAAALAQPLFVTGARRRRAENVIARAVIVDTSASMRRTIASSQRAMDSARAEAKRAADEAQTSVILETAAPSHALRGAAEWLARQAGRREIVVVSDFQAGALDSSDLAPIPAAMGLRMARIVVPVDTSPVEMRSLESDGETLARVTLSAEASTVEWTVSPEQSAAPLPELLAGTGERSRVDAAVRAARSVGVRMPVDTAHRVAILFRDYEQRAPLLAGSSQLRSPWMTDIAARIAADSLLLAAASGAVLEPVAEPVANALIIARNAAGQGVVFAVQDSTAAHERLLLVSSADAGSRASAALVAAAMRAVSLAPPIAELDPALISEATLAGWNRAAGTDAPAPAASDPSTGTSDARWLWVVVVLLLGVETWMRRERRVTAPIEAAHDRAA